MALDLFYREDGDPAGPPVLLEHAFPTSNALWEHQIEALGARYRPPSMTRRSIIHLDDANHRARKEAVVRKAQTIPTPDP